MVWIRSATTKSIRIHADLATVRELLLDVVRAGTLMPGVERLTRLDGDVYHYELAAFNNGAVHLVPDYQAKFDASDPGAITWEPHGEHNFKSWGTFRTEKSAVDSEILLHIETRSEASVAVAPVMVPLIEPFAQKQVDEVTEGFLRGIKDAVE